MALLLACCVLGTGDVPEPLAVEELVQLESRDLGAAPELEAMSAGSDNLWWILLIPVGIGAVIAGIILLV